VRQQEVGKRGGMLWFTMSGRRFRARNERGEKKKKQSGYYC